MTFVIGNLVFIIIMISKKKNHYFENVLNGLFTF